MRIIAIGVEEQLTSPENSVHETQATETQASETLTPVSEEDFDTRPTDVSERTTLPSARASRPDELGIPAADVVTTEKTKQASLSSIAAEQPTATVPTNVETKSDSEPEEVADVVDAEPVLSRRPPPPRRRSLPAVASEPQIAVAEVSTSERELVAAEAASIAKSEEVRGDGEATELSEPIETVETIEPVEPVEPIQSPNIPGAPALPREGAMPTPPSRVPREPPPRPRAKSEATVETAAKAEAVAPAPQSETLEEKPKARPRRLWWEDLFNEDFSRALVRLSEHQIEQEVTFIEDSLGVAPGAVVLDLGCGSGEHAVELASRGYGVVGYDLSLHQLALAQETAQERGQKLNFLQGDMREMAFEEVFDGIYCWNTTFGYFEEEKNVNVVERMFQALKPGGTLLIDVINRDFAAGDQPSSVWFEGDSCVCMDDMNIDFLTSRMRVKRSLILDDGRTRECTYSIRLYSLHELGKILHSAGFRVTEASGHPTTPGVFLGQSSPRIIILAQKP
jgi:SAM-dependent methyltransferase